MIDRAEVKKERVLVLTRTDALLGAPLCLFSANKSACIGTATKFHTSHRKRPFPAGNVISASRQCCSSTSSSSFRGFLCSQLTLYFSNRSSRILSDVAPLHLFMKGVSAVRARPVCRPSQACQFQKRRRSLRCQRLAFSSCTDVDANRALSAAWWLEAWRARRGFVWQA